MIDARGRPPASALPNVPPEFDRLLTRVGYLNYAWTNTESMLIHILAGLVPTDKETATIIHVSLNTTRARIDLLERLAKRGDGPLPEAATDRILKLTRRMRRLSGIRNRLNHSLYAFDPDAGTMRSIQMKIADRKTGFRIGEETMLDEASVEALDQTLNEIRSANTEIWTMIAEYDLPG